MTLREPGRRSAWVRRLFVVAGLGMVIGLAGCTVVPTVREAASTPAATAAGSSLTPEPSATGGTGASKPTNEPTSAGASLHECRTPARYDSYQLDENSARKWAISGVPIDAGVMRAAGGDASSDLTRYTVAAGDSFVGIGARFCVDSVHLMLINGRSSNEIFAGETIRLYPSGDPDEYLEDPAS